MRNNKKKITKRLRHTKIKEGYCLICGNFGLLSPDHVPPKGAITIRKVEQRLITESMVTQASKIKGIRSPNGSKFKTICHVCNNEHLGKNDDEISRVCKDITKRILDHVKLKLSPYNDVRVKVNALKFVRAMTGHILAATTIDECKQKPVTSPYFTPLRDFVLGDDASVSNTHDFYYWYYPFDKHLSCKSAGFYNNGHSTVISILSFFPIAFMITKKGEGIFPFHAKQLTLSDTHLYLDCSKLGISVSEFPFHGLKGNQFMLLDEAQAIISYPIPK